MDPVERLVIERACTDLCHVLARGVACCTLHAGTEPAPLAVGNVQDRGLHTDDGRRVATRSFHWAMGEPPVRAAPGAGGRRPTAMAILDPCRTRPPSRSCPPSRRTLCRSRSSRAT